jgi:hypothetical protein
MRTLARLSLTIALLLLAPCAAAQVVGQLAEGVHRFDADPDARRRAVPSMSFVTPMRREATRGVEAPPAVEPRFSEDDAGRQIVEIGVALGTSLYGTGECSGPLERTGRRTIAWNTDAYAYDDETVSMYQSHPWVLAVRADGSSFGVLADTTHRVEMDLTSGIRFTAEGPPHPVIVFEMPPKWAIGYHQCRYSYFPDTRVKEVADTFREKRIPADVIWMDIDYMDGFRCFTFDEELFPDPEGLNAYLDSIGWSNIWMINPGIKNEDGYFIHDAGNEVDAWVRTPTAEYRGFVWPGECVFPDYTNQGVREWWATLYEPFMAYGGRRRLERHERAGDLQRREQDHAARQPPPRRRPPSAGPARTRGSTTSTACSWSRPPARASWPPTPTSAPSCSAAPTTSAGTGTAPRGRATTPPTGTTSTPRSR